MSAENSPAPAQPRSSGEGEATRGQPATSSSPCFVELYPRTTTPPTTTFHIVHVFR